MKRMVTLMLVLGVASIVTATPLIQGPTTIVPGGSATYTLVGTAAEATGDGGDPVGGFVGNVWVDYDNYGEQISNLSAPTLAMGGLAAIDTTYMNSGFGFVAAPAAGDWSESTDVDEGTWLTFDISPLDGAAVGDTYDIQILDGSFEYVSSFIVEVVPEPMTIGLLGLGGLFLRRRKNA